MYYVYTYIIYNTYKIIYNISLHKRIPKYLNMKTFNTMRNANYWRKLNLQWEEWRKFHWKDTH